MERDYGPSLGLLHESCSIQLCFLLPAFYVQIPIDGAQLRCITTGFRPWRLEEYELVTSTTFTTCHISQHCNMSFGDYENVTDLTINISRFSPPAIAITMPEHSRELARPTAQLGNGPVVQETNSVHCATWTIGRRRRYRNRKPR